jgi:hypothetical protein
MPFLHLFLHPKELLALISLHTLTCWKKGNKYIMIYKGYTNEYPLPDENLGLYSVESFVLPL